MQGSRFSRRDFLHSNSILGLLGTVFLNSSFTDKISSANQKEDIWSEQEDRIRTIGETTLPELRTRYRSELFDKFLPAMNKIVIDHELGGFMCDIDNKNGKLLSTNKRAWFEGRGIWLYSFLYNHFGNDPKHLEVARKSKDFILKHLPAAGEFWNASYTKEGEALPVPGDIFCNLYIAEGLAEYSKATGEAEYFNLSKKILLQSVKQYDSDNYSYTSEKTVKGPRVLNHWMIMLCNATQMLNHKHDSEIEDLARRCVEAIMNSHLNPDWRLLDMTLSHNFNRLSDPELSQRVSFGLAIQALWMVLSEAIRIKDVRLFSRAQELFKRHVKVAEDSVYGGYYWSLDNVRTNSFKLGKTLSLHDEILIGSLLLIEHKADSWASDCFSDTYNYIIKNFIKESYAFPVESGDRKLASFSDKGMGIYHHPRQLMLNLLAIERIIARNGKVSDAFA